jgi:uncharacterized protein (DUF2267 family)
MEMTRFADLRQAGHIDTWNWSLAKCEPDREIAMRRWAAHYGMGTDEDREQYLAVFRALVLDEVPLDALLHTSVAQDFGGARAVLQAIVYLAREWIPALPDDAFAVSTVEVPSTHVLQN